MIVELFGAPGSGKTYLIRSFLQDDVNNQEFLTRAQLSEWQRARGLWHKLFYVVCNLPLVFRLATLLVGLRVALRKKDDFFSWISRAVLNEVLLREFAKKHLGSIILLDQGSVQRIVCDSVFSSHHRAFLVKNILYLIFTLTSKGKVYVFVDSDPYESAHRVISRKKNPVISRFDSLESVESLRNKMLQVNMLFESLISVASSKGHEIVVSLPPGEKNRSSEFRRLVYTISR